MSAAPMGKADLHIHTRAGDGVDSVQAILDHVEHGTDLDVIAITEHDNLDVAFETREAWARGRYRFDLVTGCEITTLEGHLVALYLEEPVPSLMRIEDTVDAVHRQGGVCFVPHPMSWLTRSLGPKALGRITSRRQDGLWFDGIELANPAPTASFYMSKARRLNDELYGLPVVGASDAHFVQAIGSGYTAFEGSSALDLRHAFASGAVSGYQTRFPSLREIGFGRALAVPIAGLGATPRRLGWKRTTWSFVSRYLPCE
ncbi:MAG: phosphotransferase [Dehalococcoidia bacterium]|nr:phosphotransferase [Dehalococcoidia bacterium]